EFRRRGLGIYATIKGDEKPTPFIEDPAIDPKYLADYTLEVLELCKSMDVDVVFYGHASVGVIHTRPLLNLKSAEGIEKYAKISQATFELVKKYGGSWSGEHGDGLIRSYQNKNLFGEKIYDDFLKLKKAFDPNNLFNPGKIVNAPAMTESLRYGSEYKTKDIKTYFDFSKDEGFAAAIEMCSGVGACRKTDAGTMCPSFMATRDEEHSTRGRANILREAISGKLPGGLASQEVYEAMELCLECKACKAECPSQVDMAKIKYEFLQQYYDQHGRPLTAKIFGYVYKTAPYGRFMAPIANLVLPTKPFRWLLQVLFKVDSRRMMPLYANRTFKQWLEQNRAKLLEQVKENDKKTVALYVDTWTMYHVPHLGEAAIKVLEAFDYKVEIIPYSCCGRTLISKGLIKDAKKQATSTRDLLHKYWARGISVVGLEPSCVASFQDDYLDLIPSDKTVEVSKNVLMIEQFLTKEWVAGKIDPSQVFDKNKADLLLHGHCQQKAVMGTAASQAVLEWVSDQVDNLDAGCCGMAGSFGYSHYDVSMKIGEDRLFPAVREHDGEVAALGFSCR
ncbi:MAG TPA: oxidoreductase, partial [Trueperaceae bacterium]|nr:oxidoreductase [Trueperaceae bacterium]